MANEATDGNARSAGVRRWRGPLLGIGALALAGALLAFAIHRQERGWQRSFAEIVAEPRSTAWAPSVAPEPPGPAVAAPTVASQPNAAPAPLPAPLVIRMEPPINSELADAALLGGASATAAVPAPPPAGYPVPAASASVSAPLLPAGSAGSPSAIAAPSASAAPVVVECGKTSCAAGQVCCNASCGICTAPGAGCSKAVCGQPFVAESVSCGRNTCNVGELCCNASCGTCARPGAPCDTQKRCSGAITYPESQSCGLQTCNVGLVCCNPSCGICAAPGAACSDRVCD